MIDSNCPICRKTIHERDTKTLYLNGRIKCPICWNNIPTDNFILFNCNHGVCCVCWRKLSRTGSSSSTSSTFMPLSSQAFQTTPSVSSTFMPLASQAFQTTPLVSSRNQMISSIFSPLFKLFKLFKSLYYLNGRERYNDEYQFHQRCSNCGKRHNGECRLPPRCSNCGNRHNGECRLYPICSNCGKRHNDECRLPSICSNCGNRHNDECRLPPICANCRKRHNGECRLTARYSN